MFSLIELRVFDDFGLQTETNIFKSQLRKLQEEHSTQLGHEIKSVNNFWDEFIYARVYAAMFQLFWLVLMWYFLLLCCYKVSAPNVDTFRK